MHVTVEDVLCQLVCRLPECGGIFHICRSCYRGQRYCSPHCRHIARRRQLKAANLRYRKTPEARLDQRDRQRSWRQRHKYSVMDQGSFALPSAAVSVCHGSLVCPSTAVLEEKTMVAHVYGRPRCVICGRVGRFVNPFRIRRRHSP